MKYVLPVCKDNAGAVPHRFGNAAVRSHIIALALRETRRCLRRERRDAMVGSL